MRPQGYRPGQGDPAIDAMRARLLKAARAVVLEQTSVSAVSVDSIAARAGVARTIVHQQFGTMAGLLEALFDQLTENGCLADLPRALELSDAYETLFELITIYARFWDSERELFRRLRSIAAFDLELRAALRTRDEHRRDGLRNLARRLAPRGLRFAAEPLEVLFALTSFEFLDGVAGSEREIAQVVPVVQGLSRAALSGHRA
jgi:AcrR family transcriptional regulator